MGGVAESALSVAEVVSVSLIVLRVKVKTCMTMIIVQTTKIAPTEGSFKSVGVDNAHFSPNHDPRSGFFRLLNAEDAVVEAEDFRAFLEQLGENSLF